MQTISPQQAEKLIDALSDIASRASAAILAIPLSQAEQRTKKDLSPVTAADEASEAIILEGLAALCPGVPVVAEESVAQGRLPDLNGGSFFLVDPLDGTKEFIAGRDEYTVNIALISNGTPIAGVIAAPAQGLLWRGVTGGDAGGDAGGLAERLRLAFPAPVAQATERHAIHTRPAPARLKVATSRSHLDSATQDYMDRLPIGERYMCGSSVKFCHLAEGSADIYPRLSPTCEWDIAAGIAILTAAGGIAIAAGGGGPLAAGGGGPLAAGSGGAFVAGSGGAFVAGSGGPLVAGARPLCFGSSTEKFLVPGFIAAGDIASLPGRA